MNNINRMTISAVGLGLSAVALMQLDMPHNPFNIGCLCLAGQALTHGIYSFAKRCLKSAADSLRIRTLRLANNRLTEPPDVSRYQELKRLDLDRNQLTEPPDVSHNSKLKFLGLNNNQLTEAPDLSQNSELVDLFLEYNLLTRAPDVSHNSKLEVLELQNNRLTEAPDVSHNSKLKFLGLNNNRLTETPDVSQNPELQHFRLSNNRLTEAPDVSQNRMLKYLHLDNNRLNVLHDSIFNLPSSCRVNAEGNLFSPEYAQHIQQRIAAIRRDNPDLGPYIYLGIHDAAAAEHGRNNLEAEINSWLAEDQEERKSDTLVDILPLTTLGNEHKQLLGRYLAALKHTADYSAVGEPKRALIARVNSILRLACENPEFRDKILHILLDREEQPTCGDGVMVQLNDIEVLWHIFHKEHELGEFKELAANVQRHEELKSHAKEMAARHGWGDEAEIILGYQILLKDSLRLPISTQGMLYPGMANGITPEMIDHAEREIDLPTIDLLARSELWRNHLKKDEKNQRAFDDLDNHFGNRMNDLNTNIMSDREYQTAVEQIRRDREEAFCELTMKLTERQQ